MERKTLHRYTLPALIFLSLLLLAYTVCRAAALSFTWDETYSYLHYVKNGELLPHTWDVMSANHHLLNTWGMMISAKLFGTGELALRLPALIAHVIYLFFSVRIVMLACSEGRHRMLRALIAFMLLNVHPYLLDFFSLARGYGLSVATLVAGVYYCYKYIAVAQKKRTLAAALFWLALAVLSNLVLLNVFLPAAAWLCLYIVLRHKEWRLRLLHLAVIVSISGLLLAFILPHAIKLRDCGALNQGTDELMKGCIRPLWGRMGYEQPWGGEAAFRPMFILVCAMLAAAAGVLFVRAWKKKRVPSLLLIALLLLASAFLCMLQQHYFMGTLYTLTRTGLFYVVLILLVAAALVIELPSRITLTGGSLFAAAVLLHFIFSANTSYVLEWKEGADTRAVAAWFKKNESALLAGRKAVTLCADHISWYPVYYYIDRWNMPWLKASSRTGENEYDRSDFYLCEKAGLKHAQPGWKPVMRFPSTGNVFFSAADLSFNAPAGNN